MNTTIDRSIDEDKLIKLLRLRYSKTDQDDDCPALETVAQALLGSTNKSAFTTARDHLQHCSGCAEAMMLIHGLQAQGLLKPLKAPIAQERSVWFSRRVFYMPAIAAVAAVILVVLVLVLFHRLAGPETGMVVKGETDEIYLAVQRGSQRFKAKPMDRLLESDHIGLFYSAPSAGYLVIYNLDERGQVTLLHPVGLAQSSKIEIGYETPLPSGGVVKNGSGCEWVVAVFSNQPLPLKEIESQLGNSRRDLVGCGIEVSIPEARAVRVFPITR